MKLYLYNRWLPAAFVAVMAFAAGANMPPVADCFLPCACNAKNEAIIRAAAIGLTFNATLWLSIAASGGAIKKLVLLGAVFCKLFLCGVACRAIAAGGAGALGAAAIIMAAASAAAICLCFLLKREDKGGAPLSRASIFIAGVSLEAVALPALLIAAGI